MCCSGDGRRATSHSTSTRAITDHHHEGHCTVHWTGDQCQAVKMTKKHLVCSPAPCTKTTARMSVYTLVSSDCMFTGTTWMHYVWVWQCRFQAYGWLAAWVVTSPQTYACTTVLTDQQQMRRAVAADPLLFVSQLQVHCNRMLLLGLALAA